VRDLDGFDFAAQPSIRQEADPRDRRRAFHRQCRGSAAIGAAGGNRQNASRGGDRASTLVAQLAKAHGEGRLEDRLTHFGKPKQLIIDELG
jgi:hypothetical protein